MKILELMSGDVDQPQPELQSALAPIAAVQSPTAGPSAPSQGPMGGQAIQPPDEQDQQQQQPAMTPPPGQLPGQLPPIPPPTYAQPQQPAQPQFGDFSGTQQQNNL